mmetsp:Transcript_21242/g.59061  ORF Transcript_21242/g.59061 Transcript_21242/m.59061 type:complete len:231 (-) Transcript_21242:917-1609(-)
MFGRAMMKSNTLRTPMTMREATSLFTSTKRPKLAIRRHGEGSVPTPQLACGTTLSFSGRGKTSPQGKGSLTPTSSCMFQLRTSRTASRGRPPMLGRVRWTQSRPGPLPATSTSVQEPLSGLHREPSSPRRRLTSCCRSWCTRCSTCCSSATTCTTSLWTQPPAAAYRVKRFSWRSSRTAAPLVLASLSSCQRWLRRHKSTLAALLSKEQSSLTTRYPRPLIGRSASSWAS